ncbi:uncharacterized protein LOC141728134 [Zonotrichia albicollis]|uniref:uncharacterized protein LOC141728134 n=1 Tax=Zonotrichia albicollis TaxID=44394 RepID=UPI003D80D9C9
MHLGQQNGLREPEPGYETRVPRPGLGQQAPGGSGSIVRGGTRMRRGHGPVMETRSGVGTRSWRWRHVMDNSTLCVPGIPGHFLKPCLCASWPPTRDGLTSWNARSTHSLFTKPAWHWEQSSVCWSSRSEGRSPGQREVRRQSTRTSCFVLPPSSLWALLDNSEASARPGQPADLHRIFYPSDPLKRLSCGSSMMSIRSYEGCTSHTNPNCGVPVANSPTSGTLAGPSQGAPLSGRPSWSGLVSGKRDTLDFFGLQVLDYCYLIQSFARCLHTRLSALEKYHNNGHNLLFEGLLKLNYPMKN